MRALTMIAFLLSIFRPPTPPASPVCTSIASVAALLDGQYAAVTCASGAVLRVSIDEGQPLPTLGPSRVVAGAPSVLRDGAGELYEVVR